MLQLFLLWTEICLVEIQGLDFRLVSNENFVKQLNKTDYFRPDSQNLVATLDMTLLQILTI